MASRIAACVGGNFSDCASFLRNSDHRSSLIGVLRTYSLPPVLDAIIELVGCGCKTSHCSSNRCNSRKAGLNCTDLCACSDNDVPCANQPEEKYESDDDDNYS